MDRFLFLCAGTSVLAAPGIIKGKGSKYSAIPEEKELEDFDQTQTQNDSEPKEEEVYEMQKTQHRTHETNQHEEDEPEEPEEEEQDNFDDSK
jgi:hypothetical protein